MLKFKEAKRHFIKNHSLGKLTINELKKKSKKEGTFVYGDKAQILQCFSQHENMIKLFRLNRR